MSGIQHATNQSIKPFKSSEEYLYAMKEDLAEWLKDLYGIDMDVNNVVEVLETGDLLCTHANNVTRVAGDFVQRYGQSQQVQLPSSGVTFVSSAQPATFLARDNISNFINWCRKQMCIKDVLMFETDDLVLRKNEKNFVLCLLEVARRASRFGMAAPVLIQLEQEIEEEIREELDQPKPQRRITSNTQNLDEMVQHLISRCTCPTQFPMVKVSDGKYRVGDSSTLIFVRILRNHVMVRVGGGWDTLEHYLDKHDPCRCTSLTHKLAQRPATPVHEITARLTLRPDGQPGTQATLLLSRAQAPLQPVIWTPSAPSPRGLRPGPPPRPSSRSPDPRPRAARERDIPSPNRLRERPSTPCHRQTCSESKEDSMLSASTRTGREATRVSPAPRLSSSLPRATRPPSTTPQPEPHRPQIPLQPQHDTEGKLGQTWTKSQFASKLRQSATSGAKVAETQNRDVNNLPERQGGPFSARPFTPVQCFTPTRYTLVPSCPKQPTITIQQGEDNISPKKNPEFIRTFCPSRGVISGEPHARPFTPLGKGQRASSMDHLPQKKLGPDGHEKGALSGSLNGDKKQGPALPGHNSYGSLSSEGLNGNTSKVSLNMPVLVNTQALSGKDSGGGEGELERGCLFTPPPISPAQEASLYQSLEHEILANLQLLNADSNGNDSTEDDEESHHSKTPQSTPQEELSSGHFRGSYPTRSSTLNHRYNPCPSSSSNNSIEVSFDAVVAEVSKGKMALARVSVESWVNTLPGGSMGRRLECRTEAGDSGLLRISKPCMASSWSSVGSSVDSKEPVEPVKVSYVSRVTESTETTVVHRPGATTGAENQKTSRILSFKQRRSLKMPERVPSIYKLKLRPRVRPRQDHRPDRKPSKIPTPLSYRSSKGAGDSAQTKRPADSAAMPDACSRPYPQHRPCSTERHSKRDVQTSYHSYAAMVRGRGCQRKDQEVMEDPELESWV